MSLDDNRLVPNLITSRRFRWLLAQCAFAGAYVCLSQISLAFAFEHDNISPVWFPTGFSLAVVLIGGYQYLTGVFLGAFVSALLAFQSFPPETVLAALGLGVGNTLEAAFGAYFVRRGKGASETFQSVSRTCRFLVFGVLLSTILSSTLGVSILCLAGLADPGRFQFLWSVWWIGNSVGSLLITPFVLAIADIVTKRLSRRQVVELTMMTALAIMIALFVFGRSSAPNIQNQPQGALVVPLLVFSIFRFGFRGFAIVHLFVCGIAIWGTVSGHGPFVRATAHDSLMVLQGNVIVIGSTLILITSLVEERQQREVKFHELQSALNQTSRLSLMGELTTGLAHELNHPLGAILNYANGCLRRSRNGTITKEEWEEAIQEIVSSAHRASETIHRIRALIQKRETKKEYADINTIIDDSIKILKLSSDSAALQVKFDKGVALPKVYTDAVQISHVVLNLLTNSVHALGNGNATNGRIHVTSKIGNNGDVVVSVRDNGCGMDEKRVEKAFDQFFTTKPEGIGMGLAISKSIIEANRGTISVESAVGEGTLMEFNLPISPRISEDHFSKSERN